MNPTIIWVPGVPAPGGSKKAFFVKALGRSVVTDACKRNKPWRACVSMAASEAMRTSCVIGEVAALFAFVMPRPKCHYRANGTLKPSAPLFHHNRPDTTKLIRAAEDACTGIVWVDDSLITSQYGMKLYGERPGLLLAVFGGCVGEEMLAMAARIYDSGEEEIERLKSAKISVDTTTVIGTM